MILLRILGMENISKPSENNLVAFIVGKIERMWYNCVDVGWVIRRRVAVLYAYHT